MRDAGSGTVTNHLTAIAMNKTIELPATNAQKRCIHRLRRQLGQDEETYRAMIYDASNGRTDSSKYLYRQEATELIGRLLDPDGVDLERQKRQKETVKTIYGLAMNIGILNKEYDSCDPAERQMNIAKISAFMKKRGSIKKDISRQNLEELKATLKQMWSIRQKEEI